MTSRCIAGSGSLDRPDLDSRNHLARSRRRRSRVARRCCPSTSPRRFFDLAIRGPWLSFREIHRYVLSRISALVHEFVSRSKEQRGTRQPREGTEKAYWSSADRERKKERDGERDPAKRDKLLAEFPPLAGCRKEMSMRRVVVKVTRGAWCHTSRRQYSFVRSLPSRLIVVSRVSPTTRSGINADVLRA